MDVDPLTEDWSTSQVEVMNRLRDWAIAFTELNGHLSDWMGLPTSDANALGQIIWAAEDDAPLSPAELSRRIGMTSGATSILLSRLEAAGHISRSRVSADRRRVTLHPTPSARDQTRRFLDVAGVEIAATLRTVDPGHAHDVASFLASITAACTRGNERLRERVSRRRSAGTATPSSAPKSRVTTRREA